MTDDTRRLAAHGSLERTEQRLGEMMTETTNGGVSPNGDVPATDAVTQWGVATDDDIAADRDELIRRFKECHISCLADIIFAKALNRLAASESRVKELEKECEWRGILLELLCNVPCDIDVAMTEDRKSEWSITRQVASENGFETEEIVSWPHIRGEDIPVRPPDDVVARIKGAING